MNDLTTPKKCDQQVISNGPFDWGERALTLLSEAEDAMLNLLSDMEEKYDFYNTGLKSGEDLEMELWDDPLVSFDLPVEIPLLDAMLEKNLPAGEKERIYLGCLYVVESDQDPDDRWTKAEKALIKAEIRWHNFFDNSVDDYEVELLGLARSLALAKGIDVD